MAVLVAAPALRADWVGYRNDMKQPVVIQAEVVIRNVVRRGKLNQLQPGEIAWDPIVVPGNRSITIYDAKTKRVLFKGPINMGDQFFSVQTDPPGAAKIVEMKPPKKPPGQNNR